MPQDRAGMLTVSASAGYLLTTSLTNEPRREHTFPHYQQADNTWLATGDVTLLATDDSLPDGFITIRNSQAETVVLTIDATSLSGIQVQRPVLTFSEPLPAFARTSPGKPSFLILTIAQQYTNAPVMLSTDAPEYFQLASDSRPVFLPDLTLVPSPTGTHVHLRYAAQKTGVHHGHLIIETGYETRTIALKGRSSGLLATLDKTPLSVRPASLPQPAVALPEHTAGSKRWLGALALLVVAGLAFAGYRNRCQLFPALCENTLAIPTRTTDPVAAPVNRSPEKLEMSRLSPKPAQVREATPPAQNLPALTSRPLRATQPTNQTTLVELSNEQPDESRRASRKATMDQEQELTKQSAANQPVKRKAPPKSPDETGEESDLERALNKPL